MAALSRLGTVREMAVTERARFLQAFESRDFRLVWGGQTVSLVGNGAYVVAIGWKSLEITGSAGSLAIVLMAESLAMLATLLIGGALADRYDRRALMIVSDAARFGIVAAMAFVDASGNLSYGLLIAFAIGVGLGDGFFHPAFGGIVPLVVEHPHLASANALIGLSRHASYVVGPALAAAVYAPAGSAIVFALNALTFLVAAWLLWLARPRAAAREPSEGTVREILAGARYVAGVPWLWISILLAAIVLMIGYAPFQALLPRLVDAEFGRGVGAYGFLFAVQAVGMVIGSLVVGQLNPRRHRILLAYAGWALSDLGVIALIFSPWFELAAIFVALRGIFVGFGIAMWETLLMELVPEDKLSRVISLDFFGSLGLLPVGYALTALLVDVVSVHAILLTGFTLAFFLWVIPLSLRSVRTAA